MLNWIANKFGYEIVEKDLLIMMAEDAEAMMLVKEIVDAYGRCVIKKEPESDNVVEFDKYHNSR